MAQDADRFRPREPSPATEGSVSEQTPPTAPSPTGASDRGTLPDAAPQGQRRAAQQPGAGRSPYAPPETGRPQHGPAQYGQGQYGQPLRGQPQQQPPRQYAPPPSAVQRYAAPPTSGRDAPLIHPAAAQAGNRTTYGVPVYRAPVYAYAPQPQRGLSITALVLGLCSGLFAWTLVVVPLIGIVFGILALRREPAGKGMAITGLIASGLGLLWILLLYVLPLIGVLTALFGLGFV